MRKIRHGGIKYYTDTHAETNRDQDRDRDRVKNSNKDKNKKTSTWRNEILHGHSRKDK